MDGSKNPKRKLKRVRVQCRYGCCWDKGNWKKYKAQKVKNSGSVV